MRSMLSMPSMPSMPSMHSMPSMPSMPSSMPSMRSMRSMRSLHSMHSMHRITLYGCGRRQTATLPAPLRVCYLVNSGSEVWARPVVTPRLPGPLDSRPLL
jgi:hypothetical protein